MPSRANKGSKHFRMSVSFAKGCRASALIGCVPWNYPLFSEKVSRTKRESKMNRHDVTGSIATFRQIAKRRPQLKDTGSPSSFAAGKAPVGLPIACILGLLVAYTVLAGHAAAAEPAAVGIQVGKQEVKFLAGKDLVGQSTTSARPSPSPTSGRCMGPPAFP